jgi:L-ascorbate metabolism protein UlaG (beta-lactamase superfamily)
MKIKFLLLAVITVLFSLTGCCLTGLFQPNAKPPESGPGVYLLNVEDLPDGSRLTQYQRVPHPEGTDYAVTFSTPDGLQVYNKICAPIYPPAAAEIDLNDTETVRIDAPKVGQGSLAFHGPVMGQPSVTVTFIQGPWEGCVQVIGRDDAAATDLAINFARIVAARLPLTAIVETAAETVEDAAEYSNEVSVLNNKINSIPAENKNQQRTELLIQMDDFVKGSVSGDGFSSKVNSLIKLRLDQALKEISETQVPKDEVKLWYIYNMGVIAKSEDKTIAFDLAGDYVYPNMADFTKYIDILVISHFHNDHLSAPVFSKALENGVTVIFPGDKVVLTDNQFVRDPEGEDAVTLIKKLNGIDADNFISLKPLEKTMIKGVEITAYPSKHIHNFDQEDSFIDIPVNWYYVNLSGFKILFTGDGMSFDYQPDFTDKNVDLFIIHSTTLDPRTNDTLMQLVPKAITILPLHVLELGHGPDIVNEKHDWYMTYKSILDNYSNGYYKPPQGENRFLPMIWGESTVFNFSS